MCDKGQVLREWWRDNFVKLGAGRVNQLWGEYVILAVSGGMVRANVSEVDGNRQKLVKM